MQEETPSKLSAELLNRRMEGLPSPSAVVGRLMALARSDAANISDFEAVIRSDAGIATSVLKLANSAVFGLPRRVDNLRQAVSLLGIRRTVDVVSCASFRRLMPKRLAGYGMDAESYWLHNTATAILAEAICDDLKLPAQSAAFSAGLLHDCGKLVISTFLAERLDRLGERLSKTSLTFLAAEHDVLGTDHSEVGEAVIKKWGLPDTIGLVARFHHTPTAVTSASERQLVGVVHIANVTAHSLGLGADMGDLRRQVQPEIVDEIGLSHKVLERVGCNAYPRICELRDMFKG